MSRRSYFFKDELLRHRGVLTLRLKTLNRPTFYLRRNLSKPACLLCPQLGKLELPSSLLQSSTYQSPYLSLFSLTTMGTGAGVIRSRNNLARQSQL